MSSVENVAVIPARGGSKGVPRKNLRRVGGVPLLARAITAARSSERIDRVVVSTDDAEIAAVAREWGAEVIDRPADISGDTASSESALIHALDDLAERDVIVDVLIFIQATSPFIDPADLDRAVERITSGESDCTFSAVESWGFLWRGGVDAGTSAIGVNHDLRTRPRRQDRSAEYLETGAFYAMDADGFRAAGHRFFGRVGIVEVPELHAIEIDTVEQLAIADALSSVVGQSRLIDVDAVVTDFDGVHTDDTVIVSQDGTESVAVSRSDGMGVSLLRKAGVRVLILSTETNPVVGARAAKLQVEVIQGCDDKATALTEWAASHGLSHDRIAYVGNDVNDLGAMAIVGWPIAVPDSHPRVLAAARIVLGSAGGSGAVRELADGVLHAHELLGTRPDDTDHSTRQGSVR